ncbi:MAG: aminopeptidase, partial [Fimbriimonadaceae bacterium]|nr:aminopeptidase [Fimbriimonadaceae bacterium]
RYSPVETNMLAVAMTEGTGINMHPWFAQWIEKPGHPVIDWSWSWDDAKKEVAIHVKQTQDTSIGTPIYDIPAQVAFITSDGAIERRAIHLNAADQEFRLPANAKPGTVVLDPDHDFLREIKTNPWADGELPLVARYDPNCVDRQFAFTKMLTGTPSDAVVRQAVATLESDNGIEPAILNVTALVDLKRPDLRTFWQSQLKHENFQRRAAAVDALGHLPVDASENERLRGLINDKEPYRVVAAAIKALGFLDYAASAKLIEAQARTSDNSRIRGSALTVLAENNSPVAADLIFESLGEMQPDDVQQAGISALAKLKGDDPRILPALRGALNSGNFDLIFPAISAARARKEKALIPDLEALKKRNRFLSEDIDAAIADINKP